MSGAIEIDRNKTRNKRTPEIYVVRSECRNLRPRGEPANQSTINRRITGLQSHSCTQVFPSPTLYPIPTVFNKTTQWTQLSTKPLWALSSLTLSRALSSRSLLSSFLFCSISHLQTSSPYIGRTAEDKTKQMKINGLIKCCSAGAHKTSRNRHRTPTIFVGMHADHACAWASI